MTRASLLLLTGLLITSAPRGQALSESADGKGAIVIPGAFVGINLTKTEAFFDYHNFHDAARTNGLIYGLSVFGKAEEGVAGLFDDGEVSPGAGGSATLGYTFANRDRQLDEATARRQAAGQEENRLRVAYAGYVQSLPSVVVASGPVRDSLQSIADAHVAEDRGDPDALARRLTRFAARDEATRRGAVEAFLARLATPPAGVDIARARQLRQEVDQLNTRIRALGDSSLFQAGWIYAQAGLSGSQFQRYQKADVEDLGDQFEEVDFTAPFARLGANYQFEGRWLFGGAVGVRRGNTFGSLKKRQFTLTTTTASPPQTLVQQRAITAYVGEYETFTQATLDVDVVQFVPLGQKSVLAWTLPYIRLGLPLGAEVAEESLDIGTAFNFYTSGGKFIGGAYAQLRDLLSEHDEGEEGLRHRLQVGLVARISLDASLLPRQP